MLLVGRAGLTGTLTAEFFQGIASGSQYQLIETIEISGTSLSGACVRCICLSGGRAGS